MPVLASVNGRRLAEFLVSEGWKIAIDRGDLLVLERPDRDRALVVRTNVPLPRSIAENHLRNAGIAEDRQLVILDDLVGTYVPDSE